MASAGSGSSAVGWRVIGASAAGSAHEARGLPCQDAWAWRLGSAGELLLALADGAGSAARAERGAAVAVEALLDAWQQLGASGPSAGEPASPPDWREQVIPFDAEDAAGGPEPTGPIEVPALSRLRAAVALSRARLLELAAGEGRPARDFACTLTGLVLDPSGLHVAQLGDSVAVALDEAGGWQTVGRPQKEGEYANEAYFLTDADALQRCVLGTWAMRPRALVLSSDGLLRLMLRLPGFEPHRPFLEPLLRFAGAAEATDRAGERLAAFLAGPRIRARSDDDTTLLIAMRESGSPVEARRARGASARDASTPEVAAEPEP